MGGGGKKAAKKAAAAQMAMMEKAIAEQRAAYSEGKQLLDPYSQAGLGGLQSYLAMLGQSGPEAQQAAIAGQRKHQAIKPSFKPVSVRCCKTPRLLAVCVVAMFSRAWPSLAQACLVTTTTNSLTDLASFRIRDCKQTRAWQTFAQGRLRISQTSLT